MTITRYAALQWSLFVAIALTLLYLLSPILTPFVAAAILSYICHPFVLRLTGLKVPRVLAVVLVMLVLLLLCAGLLLIMLPLLEKEVAVFIIRLPDLIETVRVNLFPMLQRWFGADLQWSSTALKSMLMNHWQSAGGLAEKILPRLGDSGGKILNIALDMLLIPVAMFYLLRDGDKLIENIDALIPRYLYKKVIEISTEVNSVLAEFLRGQLFVMLIMSAFYALALWLTGLEFALPVGIVAGMLVFIPYLGMISGLVLATLAAIMQFSQLSDVMWVWGVFAVGQMTENMFITPLLIGERMGLHPLMVIFSLLAFAQLFGFFGILLALPMSAILLVALRHGSRWYLSSQMYRK
jgi:predicted PurR-regulated permease PerM